MYGREKRGFGRDRGGGFGRGPPGGFRFSTPKPIKIGEEHDVTITDVGAKGDGITKVDNFVVFVVNGKKGEKCRIRIKEVASKFAIAEKVGESSEPAEKPKEEASEEPKDEEVSEEEPSEEAEPEEEKKDKKKKEE